MNGPVVKYKISDYTILFTLAVAAILSYLFKWNGSGHPVNFIDGDARDYYSSLISTFIKHDLTNQQANEWFILRTGTGTINVHPIGVSVLLLPFFTLGYFFALLFHFPVDGLSLPFQITVAAGALTYAAVGLIFLKKLFRQNGIADKISALILLLIFFGTNLLYYTLSEAAMSHVYSFSLVAVFLYHSNRYVLLLRNKNLYAASAILGLILLVRPNNVFIILSLFIWFKNREECRNFLSILCKKKAIYLAVSITAAIVLLQSVVWYLQTGSLFHNTYKADGFYWFNPQILKMLFGFDSGFFIYTPLCFLFLGGIIFIYRENRFAFLSASALLLILFYFFSSYWAYTYFDGIGIRVLVDYYALFAFFGAKFFTATVKSKWIIAPFMAALFFVFVNLVYCYQVERNILYKTGMTYAKWKYIFLRTAPEYQMSLGGCYDFKPFSRAHPEASLSGEVKFQQPFDFSGKDFGVLVAFDSVKFSSNRIHIKIDVSRQELRMHASDDAMVCGMLDDGISMSHKSYFQFKLNDVPATQCCDKKEYHYSANMVADFKPNDKLSVYLWNIKTQPFLIDKFSVKVYNYNYQIL